MASNELSNLQKFGRLNKNLQINTQEDVKFLIIDWYECDLDIPKNTDNTTEKFVKNTYWLNNEHSKQYTLFTFGVDKNGSSVCLKITDYQPYFYLKMPDNFTESQIKDFINCFDPDSSEEVDREEYEYIASNLSGGTPSENSANRTEFNQLKFNSRYYKSGIDYEQLEICDREIFWTFMNEQKFKFVKMYFRSTMSLKFFMDYFKSPIKLNIRGFQNEYIKYAMFEPDLDPQLRFIHDRKIKPSSWISIPAGSFRRENDLSKCQYNISAKWDKIFPYDCADIPPIVVAAFDIEADSSHGDFPIPRKDCKKLANELVITWLREHRILDKESGNKTGEKYQTAEKSIKTGYKFFAHRIKQALQFEKYNDIEKNPYYDNEISHIYLKSLNDAKKFSQSGEIFDNLCREIFNICNRPIRKIKADTAMKNACKYIAIEEGRIIAQLKKSKHFHGLQIADYLEIVNKAAVKYNVPIKDLQEKLIQKDMMVRFVNQELNRYLGRSFGDKVIQIGTVFWRFGDDKPFYNNIITLGGCSPFNVGDMPCDVISCNNELDVLLEWSKLIERVDPDIILGYNIFGFDESFMYDRIIDLLIKNKNKPTIEKEDIIELEKDTKYMKFMNMTRLSDKIIERVKDAKGRMVNKKLASSALGENFLYFFNMPGRVQIDLLKVCQASLDKLPSYKLDDVAEHYISGKIKDFYPDPNYPNGDLSCIIKVDNIKEVQVGNYVTIGMTTTTQKLYDGEKLIVNEINGSVMTLNKPIPTNCKKSGPVWGLAKDDVTAKDIFRMQKGSDDDRAIIAKYCIQDCTLLIRLISKLNTIPNNFGMSNVCLIPFSYIFLRGQGIKIFSLIVNECAAENKLLPYLEKIKPDEEDVEDIVRSKHTIKAANNQSGGDDNDDNDNNDDNDDNDITNITDEDITDITDITDEDSGDNNIGDTSENIIKIEEKISLPQFKLRDDFNIVTMSEDSYEGAIVLKPKPDIYTDPITILDFGSLYPSEMIASDLSHDRICEDSYWLGEEGAKRIKTLGLDYMDRSYDNYSWVDPKKKNRGKYKSGVSNIRYIQYPDGRKGLIPRILQKLLAARKANKKIMEKWEKEGDMFKASVFDGLQLAYKLTANSLYGQIGAKTSKIYKPAIAASTTAGGRGRIMHAKQFVLDNFPNSEIVYGDTDSVFIKFDLRRPDGTKPEGQEAIQMAIDIGLKSEELIQPHLPKPHVLEYEKVFYPFILITKKRYIGMKYEFKADECKKTSMGVVTKRRDNAPILKHTFIGVVDTLMQERNIPKAIKFVQDTCYDMIADKFDLNMFVVSKTLKEYYKDPESIAHKVLADRMTERDPGSKPACNERLPYVYIKIEEKPNVEYLQGDRIEHISYVRENKCKVDYETYITNQIMKPVSQILELVVDKIPGYPYHNGYFNDLENEWYNKYGGDMKKVEKKISQIKQNLVKKLVFDPIIIKAQQKAAGNIRTLDTWFCASDNTTSAFIQTNNKIIIDKTTNNTINNTTNNISKSNGVKKYKQSNLSSFFK